MDDDYFLKALCYVELNPVRAGLADHAWDYAWSSARAHCEDASENVVMHLDDWRDRMPGETWREVLEAGKVEAFRPPPPRCRDGVNSPYLPA